MSCWFYFYQTFISMREKSERTSWDIRVGGRLMPKLRNINSDIHVTYRRQSCRRDVDLDTRFFAFLFQFLRISSSASLEEQLKLTNNVNWEQTEARSWENQRIFAVCCRRCYPIKIISPLPVKVVGPANERYLSDKLKCCISSQAAKKSKQAKGEIKIKYWSEYEWNYYSLKLVNYIQHHHGYCCYVSEWNERWTAHNWNY